MLPTMTLEFYPPDRGFFPSRKASLQLTNTTENTEPDRDTAKHQEALAQLSGTTTSSLDPKDIESTTMEVPQWKPIAIELTILITMAICSLLVALDSGILIPVLPTLAVELHGTTALAFWTGTSYLLAHAVLQPSIASLSDIFGRRELLIPSLLTFTAGSIVCALSHNFTAMLIGRTVQGIGGAGIISLSQIVYADIVPLRQRPKYFSLVLLAWAFGSLTGPLLGGVFTEHAHNWRWCFWINLPICGVALLLSLCLGRLTQPYTNLTTKLSAVDWSGNIMFVASLTSFLIGISWAGVSYEWNSYQVLTPLIIGLVGIFATIIFETKITKTPFLRKGIFRNRSAVASYLCAFLQGVSLYMAYYFYIFYMTGVLFFSPTRSGYSLVTVTALILPGSAVTNVLITRIGHYRVFVWVGFLISTISCGCLIMFDQYTKTPVWAPVLCSFGLGMGMLISAVNVAIQASVEDENTGQAAVMYAFSRSVGMAIGVSIGGTVFQNEMKRKLEELGVQGANELAKNAEGFVEVLKHMAEGAEKTRILDGYVHGFQGVWITMTALCAAGLIVSTAIRSGNLDQKLNSRFSVHVGNNESARA